MGKAKQPHESRKASAKPRVPGASRKTGKPAASTGSKRRSGEGPRPGAAVVPLSDTALGEAARVADDARIGEVAATLNPQDQETFARVRQLLAEHLGSDAAARVWLVTPGTGFTTTALDAVRAGQVGVVLVTLEAQWGPSPIYA